ncbi:hypothetical protein IEQ34_009683 [Dendrobium chrysotoxum]|uniref:Uncharacterized protein n=1 Tax=Dendrobium chrysotoxum TaxID=161865 RepID=A0AAV7H348_DENCH|nr:hypothetical protein IEQ34_009683 [Dendrobium chrysotoxum]
MHSTFGKLVLGVGINELPCWLISASIMPFSANTNNQETICWPRELRSIEYNSEQYGMRCIGPDLLGRIKDKGVREGLASFFLQIC